MAKFALECPKCGSLNTASTFILAKKVINCGTCGEEIHVKNSRLISKECPTCKKIVVCDQAKLNGKKCPFCGDKSFGASLTAEYKKHKTTCPQCYCRIEIDKSKTDVQCPICDKWINVQEQLVKEEQVSAHGISVIKYEGDNETFVWKHPIEDFNLGSQLIVHESQEAIFFLNGQALDLFGPGRHSLETENLPLLKKVYNLPTGQQNPFHAEVYFINKTVQMGLKWGTDSRVRFIEPNTGIPLDIGAYGEMNLQVSDSRKLLVKLVGTTRGIAWSAPNAQFTKSIYDAFRPLVMTTVKTHLAATIKAESIHILEIDENLEILSAALREKVSAGFEEYGLCVPQFYVSSVALPEQDPNFKKIRDLLAASYLGVRQAEVEAEIAAAERKATLERQITETEIAKHEAERARLAGFAEAEVMAAKGYNEKDLIQAEVQKAYAQGIGQMGSNGGGNGGGGSMMADILGLGVGMAAMGTVGEKVGEAMKGFGGTGSAPAEAPAAGWTCSCGCSGNTGKFCSECGKPKAEEWECASCGAKGNKGKFCSECGTPKPELWECPHCGAKGNKGKFCSECGKKKEEQ